MKTYSKDFSISSSSLVNSCSELEEVVCNRQSKFRGTAQYLKAKEEAMEVFRGIEALLPEERKAFMKLEELFFWVECICYSAAYRDGMNDLITSMTLTKLGITNVGYPDLSSKGV